MKIYNRLIKLLESRRKLKEKLLKTDKEVDEILEAINKTSEKKEMAK